MQKVIIIGNGIAGVTAARYIRKWSDNEIIIISEETDHFFSRTALMYIYMGHMEYKDTKPYEDSFWTQNRIQLIKDRVNRVDFQSKRVYFSPGKSIDYDVLILATGSKPRFFDWPGQEALGVQGLYSYQDLELLERNTLKLPKRAVVVGGGLIGIEFVEMLLSRKIPVTFLVRESSYWNMVLPAEESGMINRHIREHGVDLRLSTSLSKIQKDHKGWVKSVRTSTGEEIECDLVGITTGVTPNVEFLKDSGLQIGKGILVTHSFCTNFQDVYAIGDCAEFITPLAGRAVLEQVWYTGKMHGETVAHNVCVGPRAYTPVTWFNSAKFFDIEYQIYGKVQTKATPTVQSIYWEHPKGRKSIRIDYLSESLIVKGFNLMGIRYSHDVCERWLDEERDIKYVVDNLSEANFDTEFFRRYEKDIQASFALQNIPPPIQQEITQSLK